jgi:hypothetical protein
VTRGKAAFGATVLAVLLSAGLVVAACYVPMYSDGSTLVAVNGAGVLVPVAIPLLLSVSTYTGLHLLCKRGSVAGERAAIACMSIACCFALITGFSIGILVLPIAVLLATGVALTPRPA